MGGTWLTGLRYLSSTSQSLLQRLWLQMMSKAQDGSACIFDILTLFVYTMGGSGDASSILVYSSGICKGGIFVCMFVWVDTRRPSFYTIYGVWTQTGCFQVLWSTKNYQRNKVTWHIETSMYEIFYLQLVNKQFTQAMFTLHWGKRSSLGALATWKRVLH